MGMDVFNIIMIGIASLSLIMLFVIAGIARGIHGTLDEIRRHQIHIRFPNGTYYANNPESSDLSEEKTANDHELKFAQYEETLVSLQDQITKLKNQIDKCEEKLNDIYIEE